MQLLLETKNQYPPINLNWRAHWENLNIPFSYLSDIRKAIYTINAIESLNSVIRKFIKRHKLFPNDNSAIKVVYLVMLEASKKWAMPLHNWKGALNRFIILFEERVQDCI